MQNLILIALKKRSHSLLLRLYIWVDRLYIWVDGGNQARENLTLSMGMAGVMSCLTEIAVQLCQAWMESLSRRLIRKDYSDSGQLSAFTP